MPSVIRVTTPLPGPKSLALGARRAAAVPKGVSISSGLAVVRAIVQLRKLAGIRDLKPWSPAAPPEAGKPET